MQYGSRPKSRLPITLRKLTHNRTEFSSDIGDSTQQLSVLPQAPVLVAVRVRIVEEIVCKVLRVCKNERISGENSNN